MARLTDPKMLINKKPAEWPKRCKCCNTIVDTPFQALAHKKECVCVPSGFGQSSFEAVYE